MKTPPLPRAARGFSLVELMISIVIGMLALMFATRMVVNAEVNKQAAVGGSDSMQNGIVGLFSIEKDLQQGGWGLNDPLINGCDTSFTDSSGYALLGATRSSAPITPLAPAVIQSNGSNPDTIAIYSGSSMGNTGTVRLNIPYVVGANTIDIDRLPYGFAGTDTVAVGGDVIVVAQENASAANKCVLAQVAGISAPSGRNVLSIGAGGNNRFNTGNLGIAFPVQSRIFNLGPASSLSFHTWSLDRGYLKLRATNLAGATAGQGATVIDNVVSLKAQYGLDTRSGANFTPEQGMQVTAWSNTIGDADMNGVEDGADYQRIAAVRIAVVARSKNPEKPNAAGTCVATSSQPTVFGGAITVNVAVTGDTIDWKCYRYRSFETIVPIRNSAWRPTA